MLRGGETGVAQSGIGVRNTSGFRVLTYIAFGFRIMDLETVDCTGKDSGGGASTSSPKPDEWQMALDLPDNQVAPECTHTPGRVSEPCNRRPFRAVRGHGQPPAPRQRLDPIQFWANSPLPVLPKNEILAESEFAAPTITKLIPIPFSTSRSFLRFGYEVSFEALDKGAIEILGPYGISYTFRRLAERISQLRGVDLLCEECVMTRGRLPGGAAPPLLREDIRGSSEWRFPCREPDGETLTSGSEHGRIKSNDFSKSSQTDYYSESSDY
ncbi:NADH:ubiquinone dehydrogenase subunit 5 [Datura stramonium]|uniref:NADH:ubiquinone dehydrogenase subunit 5 n=1 Tax=Datura stramonium TaxID=4076 RepID=A0ABS8ULF6_DATST|nr:NADH:ubiquinone dehydrogenase subunit 5 [Datura stramonium]